MVHEKILADKEKITKSHRLKDVNPVNPSCKVGENTLEMNGLQRQIGNRVVQRLLAQRSNDGTTSASLWAGTELDDDTTARINRERSGGQALDGNVQARMSEATGQDFSEVKVHTGSESHALNEQLSAKAFTTGADIFFREGAYDPGSSGGQELLAHELTHVVQQRSGAVGGGGGRMTVNAPGDAFEQQADSVAKAVTGQAAAPAVQRQTPEEEDEVQAKALQRQEIPEDEEEVQTKALQREEAPDEDEEELVQKQEEDDEEELNA
jgi:hypothetical protein